MSVPRGLIVPVLALALLGCPGKGLPTAGGTPKGVKTSPGTAESPSGPAGPAIASSASPAAAVGALHGRVLDREGKPAPGVPVGGYLLSNNGGGLIGDHGGALIGNHAGSYRALAAEAAVLTATTDADGHFDLTPPAGTHMNLEARASDELKAALLDVGSTDDVTLKLDFTGTISGQVTAPGNPGVTNFEGVDVYIPGLPYSLKTDATGHFSLKGVPVGTFEVVATKTGLGRASAAGVKVAAKADTTITLALAVEPPTLTSLEPALGKVGDTVTVHGAHFGASTGAPVLVFFGGKNVGQPERKDDQTITFTIPEGAASGPISIRVGDVPSNELTLSLIEGLAITPSLTDLVVGETRQLAVQGTATGAAPLPVTGASWRSGAPAVTVDATGLVTAAALGQATLTATLGTLTASVPVTVHAVKVGVETLGKTGLGATARKLEAAAVNGDGLAVLLIDEGSPAPGIDKHSLMSLTADGTPTAIAQSELTNNTGTRTQLVAAASGDVLVSDGTRLRRLDRAGHLSDVEAANAAAYHGIVGVAGDAAGNVYLMDAETVGFSGMASEYVYRLYHIKPDGTRLLLAENPQGTGDGALTSAKFNGVSALAVTADGGTLYVAETRNQAIRRIDLAGASHPVTTLARGGGALLGTAWSLGLLPDGQLMVLDGAGVLRRITSAGSLVTELGGGADDYVVDEHGDAKALGGDLFYTRGMGLDASGRVIIPTLGNILRLTFTRGG